MFSLGCDTVNRKILLVAVCAALILIAGIAAFQFSDRPAVPPRTVERLTVAYADFESRAPFFLAQKENYFEKNGLDVTGIPYPNGVIPIQEVIDGRADIALGPAEFPVVAAILRGEDIRILGATVKASTVFIVARNDSGIANISDLRGKRVGSTPGTSTAFCLDRFLTLHGIPRDAIVPVAIKDPADLMDAVEHDRIDAVVILPPLTDQVWTAWGGRAVMWNAQGNQPIFGLAIATGPWTTTHPETIRRFLVAMDEGIQHANNHPDDARAVVREHFGITTTLPGTIREEDQFGLTLDRSLVIAMEDEARWMIRNNLTNATDIPDFTRYMYLDGIQAVSPEAVNIL